MKGRILYSYLTVLLCLIGLTNRGFAQTITNVTFSKATVCAGEGITVTFTTSTSFSTGNVFTAYLSDVTGGSYPTQLGTPLTSRTGGTITGTIPSTAVNGKDYRIQIAASNASVTKGTSLSTLTVNVPTAPSVTNPDPYCEGATAKPLSGNATGQNLKWYGTNQNGSGSTTATVPFTSAAYIGNTPYYVSQTIGGCESAKATITVMVKDAPVAPTTSSLSYCVGQTASALTATPLTGATLNWYGTNLTGGTPSSLTPVPSTTATGTTTYYVSQTQNGCEGPRASLAVTVNGIPSAPPGISATYCEGSQAQPLSATGQNLKWYGTSLSGGSASSTPTTPSTTIVGTTPYYVSQTVNGCESARTGIPVLVKAAPTAPGTSNIEFCQNGAVLSLTATLSANATVNWYGTNQTGGTASNSPPTLSSATPGTAIYYVSQTVNGCESARANISVRVKALPVLPGVSSINLCNNGPTQPLTATGAGLKWYDASDNPLGAAPTPTTSTTGTQTYKVSQTIEGCEGAKATLTVTINAIPAAPTGNSPNAYCEGNSAQPLSASGQNLKWYGTNQSGGSGSSNATVPSTSASAIGSVTYYVTQTVNGCESPRTGIPVQVKDTPDAPGTSGIEFCQNYNAPVLTATLVNNATPNWYGTSQSGGSPSGNAPTLSNSVAGTTVYYVSQTLNGCEGPRASLTVRVKSTPGTPGVNPVSFCNNSQAQPLTANGINLKWYDVSDNPLGGTPIPNTNTVGNQTYKVSQTSNEGCEGPKAVLTVVINSLPSQPSVSPVTYCQIQQDQPAQNVTSLASNASGQALRWYNTDGNQFPNAPIPSIDKAGTQTYRVSQTVNNCEGPKADIVVTVNTVAAPTTPKPLVVYCVNDKASPLEAVGETGSQLKWLDPYGRVSSDSPTPSTLNTNVQPGGDPFYVYQIGTNGCYSPRSTIKVVVTSPPTLALAAPTGTVNLGQRAPLQLKFTSSGPYSYTLTGGYTGTSLKSDTTISVLPRGNTIYQVVTVSNGCGVGLPGNPATAQINVIVPTVSTGSLATTTLCVGTSLAVPFTTTGQFNSGNIFRVEMVSAADTSKKYAIAATANSSPITGTLPLTIPSGNYLVRVKADNPEIGITGSSSPTQLTVRAIASATLTGAQTIYEGTPANLTLAFGGDGPWTATYADSLRTYSATTSTNPYIIEVRPVRTTTYRLTNVSNTCGNGPISGTATITVAPLLGVDDHSLDPLVKTYPVPTQTILTIEIDLPLTRDPATLSLIDAGGRPILQQSTRKQLNELDLTAQPNGLYFLRIQVGDRQTVRKVLKQ